MANRKQGCVRVLLFLPLALACLQVCLFFYLSGLLPHHLSMINYLTPWLLRRQEQQQKSSSAWTWSRTSCFPSSVLPFFELGSQWIGPSFLYLRTKFPHGMYSHPILLQPQCVVFFHACKACFCVALFFSNVFLSFMSQVPGSFPFHVRTYGTITLSLPSFLLLCVSFFFHLSVFA